MLILESLHPGGFDLTRRAVDACSPQPGARLIDVGCGTGASLAYLHQVVPIETLGIDLRCDALQVGQFACPELRLACAQGSRLPIAGESCDILLAECSLSTMGDLESILADCQRVLAPGGKLAITDLYWRAHNSSKLPDQHGWINLLETGGFKVLDWEDHSQALRIMAAQAIFSGRPIESLWGCRRTCSMDATDLKSLGYFLCIAEKV